MTREEALRAASRALADAGIPDARVEARWLLMAACDLDYSAFIGVADSPISGAEKQAFDQFIQRRLSREPVSSILGHTDFMGLSFRTDKRALAPRVDSERLVEASLDATKGKEAGRIVELGVGSGCLILSFLCNRPGWTGFGLDLSPDALALAQENSEALSLADRISWLEGSWRAAADEIASADIVISNPPYIPSEVVKGLDPEVRDHDPILALDGGEDGLDAYKEIVTLCGKWMQTGAQVFLEIGFDQGITVPELLSGQDFAEISVLNDYSGHNRVVKATKQ